MSKIEEKQPDSPWEEHDQFVLFLKGKSKPLRFSAREFGSSYFDLTDHLAKYGFKGWRRIGTLHLNMEEVQAFYISDTNSRAPADSKEERGET